MLTYVTQLHLGRIITFIFATSKISTHQGTIYIISCRVSKIGKIYVAQIPPSPPKKRQLYEYLYIPFFLLADNVDACEILHHLGDG